MPIRIADANNGAFSPEEANILSSVFEETIPPRLGLDLKIKDLPLVASGTALKPRGKSMTQVNVRSMADFEPGAMQLTAALNGLPLAPDLKSVLSIVALTRRPSRQPDHAAENGALIALAQKMAFSSEGILQQLAQTALRLCGAHSAGISLLEPDGKRFYWPAIAGQWAKHRGGGAERPEACFCS